MKLYNYISFILLTILMSCSNTIEKEDKISTDSILPDSAYIAKPYVYQTPPLAPISIGA